MTNAEFIALARQHLGQVLELAKLKLPAECRDFVVRLSMNRGNAFGIECTDNFPLWVSFYAGGHYIGGPPEDLDDLATKAADCIAAAEFIAERKARREGAAA